MPLSFELSNRFIYCELVSASSSKAVCSSLRRRSTKTRSSAVRWVCKILRYLSMLVLCANNKLFCMSDPIIHSVVADDRYRRVRAIVTLETPLPGDRSETDWRLPCVVILSNAAKVCPSILASIRLPLMLPKNCPAAWLVDSNQLPVMLPPLFIAVPRKSTL